MPDLSGGSRDGQAVTIKKMLSLETLVSIRIQTAPAIVGALLTHAPDFPRWNSTGVSVQGDIKPEQKNQT